jgi:hypothetical protein
MAEPTELEMILALSGDQVKNLLVSGLSREQIITVGRSIRGLSKSGLSKNDLNNVVQNLSKNIKLRKDFFEDPLTAINKMGLKMKKPISREDLIGANPTPHP